MRNFRKYLPRNCKSKKMKNAAKIRKNNSFKDGSDLPEVEEVKCYICGNPLKDTERGYGTVDEKSNIVDVCGNCFFGDGLSTHIAEQRKKNLK